VKAIVCAALLSASYASAGEETDRASIERVIAALNDHPSVTISHEPLGEATINLTSPGILIATIRFITQDVALADGTAQTTPLLFVMKREGANWKIESAYVLASPVKPSKE
jgi:hypothetical protein